MKTEKESLVKTAVTVQEQPAPAAAAASPVVAPAIEEKPSGVRRRQTATARKCPECSKDAYVTMSPKVHPNFIEVSFRYYKCGTCNHRFKERK